MTQPKRKADPRTVVPNGQLIRNLRNQAGLSRQRLAHIVGVSTGTLGPVERRNKRVFHATLHAIADALNRTNKVATSYDELLLLIDDAAIKSEANARKHFGLPLSHDDVNPAHWLKHHGLAAFRPTFHGFPYRSLILDPSELHIILNDGRSWIDTYRELLAKRVQDSSKSTRVALLHPRSPFLETLVRKNGKKLATQVDEIKRSFLVLDAMRVANCQLAIHGHHLFNPFSLFLTESLAIVSPYFLHEHGELPVFLFHKTAKEPLFLAYRQDAMKLFQTAPLLSAENFERTRPNT